MSACTFDNPDTMRRECWQDGKLVAFYSATLMLSKGHWPPPSHKFFFGANVGPWTPGQIFGDRSAIGESK